MAYITDGEKTFEVLSESMMPNAGLAGGELLVTLVRRVPQLPDLPAARCESPMCRFDRTPGAGDWRRMAACERARYWESF